MKKKRFSAALLILMLLNIGTFSCKKQAFFAHDDAEITLTSESMTIDLNSSVKITILGYNSDGSFLWDGTRIDLTIENGTLDKSSVELEDGTATVYATGNMARGQMKISARSGNTIADPDPLTINVGQLPAVNRIVASLNPFTLPSTGGRVKIVVSVYDSYLTAIKGIAVVLESSAGTLVSRSAPMVTNQQGQVVDYLDTNQDAQITIYAGEASHSVSITLGPEPEPNENPTAFFAYSPANPVNNETVYFNASASSDNDGDVVHYQWDFGDGTYKSGKKPTHAYQVGEGTSKTFTVTLTVYDDKGAHDTISKEVTVTYK